MRRAYLLVKAAADADLLRRILPEESLNNVELIDADRSSRIASLARTLLVSRQRPVAIVMDSGSVNPEFINERRDSAEELIRAADAQTPLKIVAAVPEIEAWFLAAPEAIERVFGQRPSEEWLALGKGDPSGAFRWLANKTHRTWDFQQAIRALDDQDVQQIRKIPEVAELSAFLQEVQHSGHES